MSGRQTHASVPSAMIVPWMGETGCYTFARITDLPLRYPGMAVTRHNVSAVHLGRRANAMTDNLSPSQRSDLMSRVKSSGTSIERRTRSVLHRQGFRFRKNVRQLPGTPDVVLPKYHAIVLVNGCFWHGHLNCTKAKLPATRLDSWRNKITANRRRDLAVQTSLSKLGWRVAIVWECAYRNRLYSESTAYLLCRWIRSCSPYVEISSKQFDGMYTQSSPSQISCLPS